MTTHTQPARGALAGIKVLEIASIGPGPFCAMLLADQGAEVLRIDRAAHVRAERATTASGDLLNRGRRSVGIDLKNAAGLGALLKLCERADVLLEGFRPGVMERLGLGPDAVAARNPRLVYARMTGFGQRGPLAQSAGHDINYIALGGALAHIGRAGEKPVPPLNLVGDFGGGGLLQAFGILCALTEREKSGSGQVVDTAMIDGAATLMTMFHSFIRAGAWGARGANLLDGGAHFYDTYECADGRYISVGAIEPQFYAELLQRVGLGDAALPPQMERAHWPQTRARLAEIFRAKTRDEWCALLEGSDACFAPVLEIPEMHTHPHHAARESIVEVAGVKQPAPAPRFSRTPGAVQRPPPHPGQHTDEALTDWGFTAGELTNLRESGAIA